MLAWSTLDIGGLSVSTTTTVATVGVRILLVLLAGFASVRLLQVVRRRVQDLLIRACARGKPVAGATGQRVTTDQIRFDVTPSLAGHRRPRRRLGSQSQVET